jgi:alpha-tubulin suppressor-like RCC1 family protein
MATNFLINGSEFSDNFIPSQRFSQGGLWAWGRGMVGMGGGGYGDNRHFLPTKIWNPNDGGLTGYGLNWKEVSSAYDHYSFDYWTSAGIKTDGSLWTTGYSWYGETAQGTVAAAPYYYPASSFFVQVGSDKNWSRISGGVAAFAAIKTDGTLWTWGWNATYGQLGDGTTTNRSSPVQVANGGTNWKQVSPSKGNSGNRYMMAVKTDGTLWGWGANWGQQLGNGTGTNVSTPTQIGSGTTWKLVSCGYYNSCGVKTDGTLWIWGNYSALLGDGSAFAGKSTPVQMAGNNWKLVAAGHYAHTAIKNDGTLWSCGYNYYGNIGDGTTNNTLYWTQEITGSQWKTVKITPYHTMAIKTDGTLWGWGENNTNGRGSLGLGGGAGDALPFTPHYTPTQIHGGGTNWKDITLNSQYGIGVRDNF